MKRRLDLMAALIHNREIVFLDEPTTGLDPVSRFQVRSEVRRLNVELSITIFLTTQHLEEANELARRVGIIDHGKIVVEGTPRDLKKTVGSDLILVRTEGDTAEMVSVLNTVPGEQNVEENGRELVITTRAGPATISPAAVALAGTNVVDRASLLVRPRWTMFFLNRLTPTLNVRNLRRNLHDNCR
ncbi:MAG TPA: hypothetical protein VIJ86_03465 [Acidimicrobiales bacterium]